MSMTLKFPWQKSEPQEETPTLECGNWMQSQVEERDARRVLDPELQGKMSTKEVILEHSEKEVYPSPYHKFKDQLKKCQVWIDTHGVDEPGPYGMRYIWGYDSRSVMASLGNGAEYYLKEFKENKRHWLAFLGGPCAFAFRGMWAQGILCWISLFVAGLLQIRFRLGLVWPVVLLWHFGCYWFFNDAFQIKFMTVYRVRAKPYAPISEEEHAGIVRFVGEDIKLCGLYAVVEIVVLGGVLALTKLLGG